MVSRIRRLAVAGTAAGILGVAALYLYTLPGLRRLPKARQRSLDGITTIDDAVRYLQASGKTGWELVAAAQALVNAKMEYSRRNGWDTPSRAFCRGMGYCQQQAAALLLILRRLGIAARRDKRMRFARTNAPRHSFAEGNSLIYAARPVMALRCKFPPARVHEYLDPGGISGHMWLVVSINGVEKDVCPGHPDNTPGKVHFEVLSRRMAYGPVLQLLGHIGSMILNMRRDNAALRRMQRQDAPAGPDGPDASRRVLNTFHFGKSITMNTPGTKTPSTPLSRKERISLFLEHELDTRSVRFAAWLIRLTKGRIARLWHRQVLLLTTRGRKSGQERTIPLQFFPEGDTMIVAAANSGLSSPPGWYFNLTANPFARVEVEGRAQHVRAEELSADEAATFWPRVLQIAPDYARYPRRTSRRIPLIRLIPVEPAGA